MLLVLQSGCAGAGAGRIGLACGAEAEREREGRKKKKKVVFLNSQMEKRQGEGWEEMDSFFFLSFTCLCSFSPVCGMELGMIFFFLTGNERNINRSKGK